MDFLRFAIVPALLAPALLLSACGSNEPAADEMAVASETGDSERQPCGGSAGCEQIATIAQAHGEPAVGLYYDPDRNDAIVRWGNTLAAVMDCADGGTALDACVAGSDADETCKSEFARLTAIGGESAAFEAVFLMPGSPCRPGEDQP